MHMHMDSIIHMDSTDSRVYNFHRTIRYERLKTRASDPLT